MLQRKSPLFFLSAVLAICLVPILALGEVPTWEIKGGIFHKNGAPTIATGMYYVISNERDKVTRLALPWKLKNAGMDFAITYLDTTTDDTKFVNRSVNNGISVCAEMSDKETALDKISRVIRKYQDKISCIASFDDVDGKDNYDPAFVSTRNSLLKTLYPNQFIYMSGGFRNKIANYFDTNADALGLQAYPIGNPATSDPVTEPGLIYYPVMQSYSGAFVANPQAFYWTRQRMPTCAEMRSMAYQALASGAKALFFYTYYDGLNDMAKDKKSWRCIRNLNREIKLAEKYWLSQ